MFPRSTKSKLLGPTSILLAALSIGLILNLGALAFSLRILFRGSRHFTYLKGDRPRELPLKVRSVQLAFGDDPAHYGMEGIVADAEWNAIRPPGKGFVFLGQEHLAFGVSMWHQMHCLNHIRAVLVSRDDGSDHVEAGGVGMRKPNGEVGAGGDGTLHTCRDWRQVYDWMGSQHEKWTPDMYERFKELS